MEGGHGVGPVMGYRMFELFTPGVVTTLSSAPEAPFAASALCGLAETFGFGPYIMDQSSMDDEGGAGHVSRHEAVH